MTSYRSDIAFTETVKQEQEKRGSRRGYQKAMEKRDWPDEVSEELVKFIAARDSFYFATASADGQPYIQHRGGPKGFLKVIDKKTLGFADFSGNKQYVSLGNISENGKAHIFLMDYENAQRIKIWGTARFVEDDPDLMEKLVLPGYKARPERAILFEIKAWDVNCPQHIPRKYSTETVGLATAKLTERIKTLEAEVTRLNEKLQG